MCTPLPVSALRYAGSVATSVLPSPVAISAIVPSCSTMPPMSWTSKCRMLSVRRAASRHTAKASGSTSSTPSPSATRLRRSSVLPRRAASSRACMVGSSALISATTGIIRFTSRSCLVPKIFLRMASIIAATLYAPASRRPRTACPQERPRMVQRRGAGRVATEHPRDLRGPLIPGDDGGGGARATTAHALGHPHVLVRQRGDGSQMRDTEHLPAAAERGELVADDGGGAAADAGIDLVEDHCRRVVVAGEDDLKRQHRARELAARGDSRERPVGLVRVRREPELDALGASQTPVASREVDRRDLEGRAVHAELPEFALHARPELCRSLPSRGAEGARGAHHLRLELSEPPLVLGQQLLVPLEPIELRRRVGGEALGVLQPPPLGAQLVVLSYPHPGGVELRDLKPQQVLALRAVAGGAPATLELRARLGVLRK